MNYWQAKAKLLINTPSEYRLRVHWLVYDIMARCIEGGLMTLKEAQDAIRKDIKEHKNEYRFK